MSYIRTLKNGKPQVIKDKAICLILKNQIPNYEELISALINRLDKEILLKDAKVSKGALSNVHGDWYEWLLAIAGWNYCVENLDANVPLLLPNVNRYDVASLYNTKLYDFILDLRRKVEGVSKVKLITSNPDFVIINRKSFDKEFGNPKRIKKLTIENLSFLNEAYKTFTYKCNFEEIEGYIAVKTSLRPDRRLQIPHEGSLMKAIYTHIQTREWIINPKGLKYYAFSTKISEADRNALKTVATHSITTVSSLPQAAVDEVFEVNSLRQAEQVFQSIL